MKPLKGSFLTTLGSGSKRSRVMGIAVCAFAWLICAESTDAAISIGPWQPLFQGVDFTTAEADATEVRMQKVAALRVDLRDPQLEFYATPSNGSAPMETFGQTTTTFVNTYQVSAGVNANFFSPVNTTPNDPRDLSGLAISRGQIVSPAESGRPMLLITRTNTVLFTRTAPSNLTGYWTAVSGSDLVVLQGTNAVDPGCVTSFCGPNPRTAAGVSQDRRYLYLIVIDGRQPGWSEGATLSETAEWLRRFGVWEGLNLDGGGSTAMAVRTNATAVLMNRPSGGVQRVNGNHLGFFAIPFSAPSIASQPQSQTVTVAEAAEFAVTAAGTLPIGYEWSFNGSAIPFATNSTYRIAVVAYADAGTYSVVLSNAYGSVTSAPAVLTVAAPPGPLIAVGDNEFSQASVPASATNVVAIAAGGWHSLALRWDGSVLGWGLNANGQTEVPATLTSALAVAAGGYHSLAIDGHFRVVAWGANDTGQCSVPDTLSNVWAISAGFGHSLALQRNGRVYAWGDDTSGQCDVPRDAFPVRAIAAGGNHSLALAADGTVLSWGDNLDAEGKYAGQSRVPHGLSQVVAIAAGGWHSVALRADGTVTGWGDNSFGQAVPPTGLTNVIGIAAGAEHSLALLREGTLIGWGHNAHRQCTFPITATNVVSVAAGNYHTVAIPFTAPWGLRALRPAWAQGAFSVVVQSGMCWQYTLHGAPDPRFSSPAEVMRLQGTGSLLMLGDSAATNWSRFYRVLQR